MQWINNQITHTEKIINILLDLYIIAQLTSGLFKVSYCN